MSFVSRFNAASHALKTVAPGKWRDLDISPGRGFIVNNPLFLNDGSDQAVAIKLTFLNVAAFSASASYTAGTRVFYTDTFYDCLLGYAPTPAAWDDEADYVANDFVTHSGTKYIALDASGPGSTVYEPGVTTGWESFWDVVTFTPGSADSTLIWEAVTDNIPGITRAPGDHFGMTEDLPKTTVVASDDPTVPVHLYAKNLDDTANAVIEVLCF